ncbi:MAG: TIM-barrel domain-containing protein, partial [Bacteroidota bacterium]
SLLLATILCVTPTAISQLGDLTGFSVEGKAITVFADTTAVRFIFYRPDLLRVDFLPSPLTTHDSSLVVIRDTSSSVSTAVIDRDSVLEIASSALHIVCTKRPLRIRYTGKNGEEILAEAATGGFQAVGSLRMVSFAVQPTEHYYGTGERGTELDRRGQSFESYNKQVYGYDGAEETMNVNVPFVVSSAGYGIYFENTYPGWFDFGFETAGVFTYTAEGGELAYYLFAAPSAAGQLQLYTWLTGRQPMPPRWSLGYIQSKFGYRTESEARDVVRTMREKRIPCDALVLDLYWFRHMGDLSWESGAWPSPFTMMDDFLREGIKTIVITEPFIADRSSNHAEATSLGHVATDASGQPYLLPNWWSCNCDASLLDVTSPEAREWWWSKHPPFFGTQLAGLWTDLGEPERHPSDMVHAAGSARKVHNVYNLLWARAIYEGFSEFRPDERLFNLTRSGYAGAQRYGVIPWSGDVAKSFGGLAVQLPMMLSMGLSGLAYHNSDIGGFTRGPTTPELYIRWMQYGTFCPVTRAHGSRDPTEPWAFGEEAERISRKYIELRYRLLPYIYTLAWQNTELGLPLARPLFFSEPDNLLLASESSSYFWGDAFIVSPVVAAGQNRKEVVLPEGEWIDYWSEVSVLGGTSVSVMAPLETLPLFVRAGSIVPMQPLVQYTDQSPPDTLILRVYPAPGAEGQFTLYEDDGSSLKYRSGQYVLTDFHQELSQSGSDYRFRLRIGTSDGVYDGKPDGRSYLCDIRRALKSPSWVTKNGVPIPEASSVEDLQKMPDGYTYDASAHQILVQVATVPESAYTIEAEGLRFTSARREPARLQGYTLRQNFPNPFNPSTLIEYSVPERSHVRILVFDVLGREIQKVLDEMVEPGLHKVEWDPEGVAGGVYFYRMEAGGFLITKKLVLLR